MQDGPVPVHQQAVFQKKTFIAGSQCDFFYGIGSSEGFLPDFL